MNKEITLKELDERIKKHGPKMALADIKVDGIIKVYDKDGNLKAELKPTTIEIED